MKLIFKKELENFELNNNYFLSLMSCRINNKFGFNECQKGRDYVHELVVDQYALTNQGLKIVTQENINKLFNEITQEKYGIIVHNPTDELLEETVIVNTYFRKKKLLDTKKRLGRGNFEEIGQPNFWVKICPEMPLNKKIDYLLSKSKFLSLWPKYWGEWGEHCLLVYSNDMKDMVNLIIIDNIEITIL